MDKILNCPNNPFDCGFSCGLIAMAEIAKKIIKIKKLNDEKKLDIIDVFSKLVHGEINEKYVEHMSEKYNLNL